MSKPTSAEIAAAINTVKILADTIRDLGSVPSGHLYAQVLGHLSLQQYEGAMRLLLKTGLVKQSGHLLTWVG